MKQPLWLPPKTNTDGVWEKVIKSLYAIFKNDFIDKKTVFNELKVNFDDRKTDSIYEEGFWHLITKKVKGERLPDFPRAQKLPWCRPLLEHHEDPIVIEWDFLEDNNRVNTYIWLKDYDYIVIVQKRKNEIFLVSAFHVTGESSARSFKKKYAKRIQVI